MDLLLVIEQESWLVGWLVSQINQSASQSVSQTVNQSILAYGCLKVLKAYSVKYSAFTKSLCTYATVHRSGCQY
jgi:hypothetical protein